MEPRIDYASVAGEPLEALVAIERYLERSGLGQGLLELVKLRVSELNGCAYCIDMHTKELRAAGEDEQRLYLLQAWRESPQFSQRERAALAWTEAVTELGREGVSDEIFDEARAAFSEKELVDLTYAISVINAWNRLAIAFRREVGSYRPHGRQAAAASRPSETDTSDHITSTTEEQEIMH